MNIFRGLFQSDQIMKTKLIFIFLSLSIWVSAQSPRKVLYEHFTQASCGPCASVNPNLHPILERNKDVLVRITHQVSWPGYDPMNKDNPSEVANRVSYYGINAVPSSRMNGAVAQVTPSIAVNDGSIQAAAAQGSAYEIIISNQVNESISEMNVQIEVKLSGIPRSKAVLRAAVLEKIIKFNQAPGSNGEKEFHHVMKKYLTSMSGNALSELKNPGDLLQFSFSYKFDKLYDFRNLEIAAFVQDDANKEVLQAEGQAAQFPKVQGLALGFRSVNPSTDLENNQICGKSTSPRIQFINTGDQAIQSLKFEYSANGGTPSQHSWKGQLNYLQEAIVVLPAVELPYLKLQENAILLKVLEINGQPDASNHQVSIAFEAPPVASLKSRLEIRPLSKPQLLSFEITDDLGGLVASGSGFSDNTVKVYELDLQEDRCYKLTVNNQHISLNGTARIYNDRNEIIVNQSISSQRSFVSPFTTYKLVDNEDLGLTDTAIKLIPNPAQQSARVLWDSKQASWTQMMICDLQGNIKSIKRFRSESGWNQIVLDLTNWSAGTYMIQILDGNQRLQDRLIVVQE